MVGIGGQDRDVANDAAALDTHDVEGTDVAPDAADRRGELAEHPRPVEDPAARGEGEARGRVLDHRRLSVLVIATTRPSPGSSRRRCPPGRRTSPSSRLPESRWAAAPHFRRARPPGPGSLEGPVPARTPTNVACRHRTDRSRREYRLTPRR